ncbi:Uncharacterised protein [Mycobacteroides abscessus subsp. abscessus]|nr:Uncharacterised protein [Mycobacteroides abscessus subsp. abscessus]
MATCRRSAGRHATAGTKSNVSFNWAVVNRYDTRFHAAITHA